MKRLSHRILFSRPILIARFSSSGFTRGFSGRHDELWRNVRVCVWWDFENCHLPSGVNAFKVGSTITEALRANGIRGPVQITAFGDVMRLSRANQEALSATGINLTHVPNGGKNSSDRSLLVDLIYWVSQNPPPAHLFLISGDRDFANILHRLRMSNYNILLATKNDASSVLCSAASIMWNWNSLVKGEKLKGTHFNLPPDGSYRSWYGHSKVPLEDPFSVIEQPTCLPRENMSTSSSELHLRPIPRAVQNQIRDTLKLHPNGVLISDFANELKNSGVVLDKDYYGHKKLYRFLLSMPNLLELQTISDGQFVIYAKGAEPSVPCQSSVTRTQQFAKSSKSNGTDASISQPLDGTSSLPSSSREHLKKIEKYEPPHVAKGPAKVDIEPLGSAEQPSLVGENVSLVNAELTDSSVKDKDGTSEVGSFKILARKILFGDGVDIPEIKNRNIEKYQPPHVAKEAAKVEIEPFGRVEQPSLVGENVDLVTDSSVKDKDGTHEVGSFKIFLRKILFGEGVDIPEIKNRNMEKYQPPHVAKEAAKVKIEPLGRVEQPSLVGENVDLVTDSAVKNKDGTSEVGSLKILLRKILFGEGVDIPEIKSSDIAKEVQIPGDISDQKTLTVREKCFTSGDSADNEVKVNNLKSRVKGFDSVKPASCSLSSVKPILGNDTTFDSGTVNKKSGKSLGLFSRVLNWFKFKSSGSNSQRSCDEPSQELEHANSSSRKHQVFADDSFWKDLESFMDTKNALLIISRSTTRQQLAQNLQKEGPLVLRFLKESDILELIDKLISEKKWVEECLSEGPPFKLTRQHVGTHTSSTSSPSNSLRSIFLNGQAQSNLKSEDKRIQNVSDAGVSGSSVATNRTHSGRTRKEVLNDCHKLANEIVEKFPEGCNMGSFQKLFSEKYGYDLDIQKLGYRKLPCLLQTIPRMRTESIKFPASKAVKSEVQGTLVSDSITSHESRDSDFRLSKKDDEPNSLWDELGPIAKRREDTHLQIHADYEPLLSDDDDLSDSDGEHNVVTPETTDDSSSLLQLLRSYDDNNEDDEKRDKFKDVQGEADTDINCLEPQNSCERGTQLGFSSEKYAMKQKPQKIYPFVADAGGSTTEKLFKNEDNTDKVLNSILSSISKKV